jgi:hypothetical protein
MTPKRIIAHLDIRDDRYGGKFRRMVERGSRFLLDAIQKHHGQ